jgi:ubiquinone/menaquinone biosynthesis C-methylase UbiE
MVHKNKHSYQDNYSSLYPKEITMDFNRKNKALKSFAVISDFHTETTKLRVLEIGCFTGGFARELAPRFEEWIGIDIDSELVSIAQNAVKNKNVRFSVMNAEKLSFDEAIFDLVLCNHIYEHVPRPKLMMDEIYRVLKPNGFCYFGAGNKFAIVEPHYNLLFLSWLPKKMASIYLSFVKKTKVHYFENHLSRKKLYKLCEKFEIHDVTFEILKFPKKFYADDIINENNRFHRMGIFLLGLFPGLVPTYIFMLKKS